MTNRLILFTAIIVISFSSIAQLPKYSNEFLSIGVGARAFGMAGAQVAIVDDATAGFWNPAGLVQAQGNLQIALMHSEYFAGIAKYDFGAVAVPDATKALGFTVLRFAVDDIPDTIDLLDADGNVNYDRLRSFSAADYAFMFSYARRVKPEGLRLGGSVKIVHRKAGDYAKAWGFGIDFGMQFERNNWRFGALGKDITSTFNAWSFNTDKLEETFAITGNEIPQNGMEVTLPKLILGVARKTDISGKFSMLPALDLDITFDGKRNVLFKSDPMSIDPHAGVELGYNEFIFLRFGVGNIQQVKDIDQSTSTSLQPNLGVGVKIKNVILDYSLTNIGETAETLYSNVFSLKWQIFKQKSSNQSDS